MLNNFNDVFEAGIKRHNEIVNQIDALRLKSLELREQMQPLETQEDPLTDEQDELLYRLDRQRTEIEEQIYELDDRKHELIVFRENFANAFYKSRNIDDFMLYMKGYSVAQVHGDVEDLYPLW